MVQAENGNLRQQLRSLGKLVSLVGCSRCVSRQAMIEFTWSRHSILPLRYLLTSLSRPLLLASSLPYSIACLFFPLWVYQSMYLLHFVVFRQVI
jgi:hypothetical protein